jgi:hypothetical protein
MAKISKDTTAATFTPRAATAASKKEDPIYRLAYAEVVEASDIKKIERQVNDLIAQGYEPYGAIAIDHLQAKGGHTDVAQPMVKTEWLLRRLDLLHASADHLGAVTK